LARTMNEPMSLFIIRCYRTAVGQAVVEVVEVAAGRAVAAAAAVDMEARSTAAAGKVDTEVPVSSSGEAAARRRPGTEQRRRRGRHRAAGRSRLISSRSRPAGHR